MLGFIWSVQEALGGVTGQCLGFLWRAGYQPVASQVQVHPFGFPVRMNLGPAHRLTGELCKQPATERPCLRTEFCFLVACSCRGCSFSRTLPQDPALAGVPPCEWLSPYLRVDFQGRITI